MLLLLIFLIAAFTKRGELLTIEDHNWKVYMGLTHLAFDQVMKGGSVVSSSEETCQKNI